MGAEGAKCPRVFSQQLSVGESHSLNKPLEDDGHVLLCFLPPSRQVSHDPRVQQHNANNQPSRITCVSAPWQGRLVHFEKKLPGANVVGNQPIGTLGDLEIRPSIQLGAGALEQDRAIDPPKVSKSVTDGNQSEL